MMGDAFDEGAFDTGAFDGDDEAEEAPVVPRSHPPLAASVTAYSVDAGRTAYSLTASRETFDLEAS
jgi:hypothetical protein